MLFDEFANRVALWLALAKLSFLARVPFLTDEVEGRVVTLVLRVLDKWP